MSENSSPTVAYWHIWTDQDGISHQQQCALTQFALGSMGSGAAPQWKGDTSTGRMTTMVTVQPVGWVGDWHENPKPQWIIPLSGRWSVESMDGTKIEMGAGELSFGGDQHCRSVDGRKGHRSATIGDVPAVLMVVQFDELPPPTSPCVFE
jgi:hypothetical protein